MAAIVEQKIKLVEINKALLDLHLTRGHWKDFDYFVEKAPDIIQTVKYGEVNRTMKLKEITFIEALVISLYGSVKGTSLNVCFLNNFHLMKNVSHLFTDEKWLVPFRLYSEEKDFDTVLLAYGTHSSVLYFELDLKDKEDIGDWDSCVVFQFIAMSLSGVKATLLNGLIMDIFVEGFNLDTKGKNKSGYYDYYEMTSKMVAFVEEFQLNFEEDFTELSFTLENRHIKWIINYFSKDELIFWSLVFWESFN